MTSLKTRFTKFLTIRAANEKTFDKITASHQYGLHRWMVVAAFYYVSIPCDFVYTVVLGK